jgi:predicted DNA-binding transcriptional regulator AlpA
MTTEHLRQALRPAMAAQTLGVSKPTLARWEKQFPDFPKARRPTERVTLYDRDELIAWLDARKAVSA